MCECVCECLCVCVKGVRETSSQCGHTTSHVRRVRGVRVAVIQGWRRCSGMVCVQIESDINRICVLCEQREGE